jgi:hypothetical protein
MERLSDRWMFYSGMLAAAGVGVDDLKRIQNLIDAEEQGLLLQLPCKVGDKVYKIWGCGKNGKSIAEFEVAHIDVDSLPEIEFSFFSTRKRPVSYWFAKKTDIGKTVFLTREEAEVALAKMKGEEHE